MTWYTAREEEWNQVLLVAALVCLALWGASADAAAQGSTQPVEELGRDLASATGQGSARMLWVYVTSTCAALGMMAAYAWRRTRRIPGLPDTALSPSQASVKRAPTILEVAAL
ncbi:MAG: hypothetical protein AAGI01_05865, partial [Myxococcota bacterium]